MQPGIVPPFVLEMLDRVLRSWWTVVAGLCLGAASATVALVYLPKTYEASTTIFVAPQQVPQEYVRSTVMDDMAMRLQSLREAVLSRPYLMRLVKEFGGAVRGQEIERLLDSMRSRIEVTVRNTGGDGRRSGGVFSLTYRDSNPDRAARVVNFLADFYMQENVRFRTAQAEGTTKTIDSLAQDVLEKLQVQERAITEFKSQHLYETQAHWDANLQMLQARRQDLANSDSELTQALDRVEGLKALQAQTASITGENIPTSVVGADPFANRLAALQREYEALRARYHDGHPDVKAKKREIEDLLAGRAAQSAGDTPSGAADARGNAGRALTPLETQILAAEREIQRLREERPRIEAEINMYKRRLDATPKVEQELDELTKGLDVLRDRYRDYQGKAEEAKGSLKVEETQKGERFEVIEKATPPASPIRPVPLMVYIFGVAAGLAIFVGPGVLRTLLAPTILSESGLRELADLPCLVSIPRLDTAAVLRQRRRRKVLNVAASVLSVVVLIIAQVVFG
jgi:polysaccharide chain length determinant protein (PEP-CTERM system associated)